MGGPPQKPTSAMGRVSASSAQFSQQLFSWLLAPPGYKRACVGPTPTPLLPVFPVGGCFLRRTKDRVLPQLPPAPRPPRLWGDRGGGGGGRGWTQHRALRRRHVALNRKGGGMCTRGLNGRSFCRCGIQLGVRLLVCLRMVPCVIEAPRNRYLFVITTSRSRLSRGSVVTASAHHPL